MTAHNGEGTFRMILETIAQWQEQATSQTTHPAATCHGICGRVCCYYRIGRINHLRTNKAGVEGGYHRSCRNAQEGQI